MRYLCNWRQRQSQPLRRIHDSDRRPLSLIGPPPLFPCTPTPCTPTPCTHHPVVPLYRPSPLYRHSRHAVPRRHATLAGASDEWDEQEGFPAAYRAATFALLLPVYATLRCTIPLVDPASYRRRWLLVTLACCPLAVTAYFSALGSLWNVTVAVAAGAIASAIVALLTAGEEDTLPDLDFGTGFAFGPAAFSLLGFFIGMLWIDTLASEVVGVISLVASLFHIPSSLMGLTMLAWGNSLGDFFNNRALARRGQYSTALTACVAGPLFNMLTSMALGFSSYFARHKVSRVAVELRPEVALGCAMLVGYSAALLAVGFANKFVLPQRFYLFARAWYGVYFVLACGLSLFG